MASFGLRGTTVQQKSTKPTKKDVRDLFSDNENRISVKRKSQTSGRDNVKRPALNNLDENVVKYQGNLRNGGTKQPFKKLAGTTISGRENVVPRPNTRSATANGIVSSYVDKFNSLSIRVTKDDANKIVKKEITTTTTTVKNLVQVEKKLALAVRGNNTQGRASKTGNDFKNVTKPLAVKPPVVAVKRQSSRLKSKSSILPVEAKQSTIVQPDRKISQISDAGDVKTKQPVIVLNKISIVDGKAVCSNTADSDDKKVAGPSTANARATGSKRSSTSSERSSLYLSVSEDISDEVHKTPKLKKRPSLPDFDKELLHDPHQMSLYAMDIFEYLKSRETMFVVNNYMMKQPHINRNMRSMLVDWMVEVQENFELNHETLYLAVKLMDIALSKFVISKERLQLVGATAIFLSSKYEERLCPMAEDFIQICDQAYEEEDLLIMEQRMLKAIGFQLSAPLSYRFLRRYGRCARIQMPLLTLARYILELSLMHYEAVFLSESKQAAAALYLAFKMKNHGGWTQSLEFYSGYKLTDFKDIVLLFNDMLRNSQSEDNQLTVIKDKYSHKIFFEVANAPILSNDNLGLDI